MEIYSVSQIGELSPARLFGVKIKQLRVLQKQLSFFLLRHFHDGIN